MLTPDEIKKLGRNKKEEAKKQQKIILPKRPESSGPCIRKYNMSIPPTSNILEQAIASIFTSDLNDMQYDDFLAEFNTAQQLVDTDNTSNINRELEENIKIDEFITKPREKTPPRRKSIYLEKPIEPRKRGRPRKDSIDIPKVPKKRGRPPKNKTDDVPKAPSTKPKTQTTKKTKIQPKSKEFISSSEDENLPPFNQNPTSQLAEKILKDYSHTSTKEISPIPATPRASSEDRYHRTMETFEEISTRIEDTYEITPMEIEEINESLRLDKENIDKAEQENDQISNKYINKIKNASKIALEFLAQADI